MRNRSILAVLIAVLASGAPAQQDGLRSLETGVDARAWEAVGRLDFAGDGFCTGALIASDLVLTAAHCLYDSSGNQIDHAKIQFLAGWRNGRASAYRDVRRAVVHPDYTYGGEVSSARVRNDVALLELVRPIQNTTIDPFGMAARPVKGDSVGVVSYGRDRAQAPALQEVCTVLSTQSGVLLTSCSVDFGSSGAPIFTFADGTPQIVSVVSAKAKLEGENVAFGTDLQTLHVLQAELDAGRGFFANTPPITSRVTVGQRRDTGAKFIRPTE